MLDRQIILDFLGDDWTGVQALIVNALYSDVAVLREMNEYIVQNSGKQIRPVLSLLMARACSATGKTTEDSIKFAAAAELLHNATLLHDDVTDRSDIRRGKPTVWALMGTTPAVLIGDFWLSKAVEIVVDSKRRENVVRRFCSTMANLAEGEMLQMEKAASADTSEDDYLRIIYNKTASLFEAAIVSAAISVDAPDNLVDAADRYARSVGMAFQIRDDILDYCGKDEMGKPSGVDLREKKITLPLLGAIARSGRGDEIRAMLKEVDVHPEYIAQIHDFVMSNGGLEYASSVLDGYVSAALKALDAFGDSQEKKYLAGVAEYNRLREI